jgi:hypothetical protein
LLDLCEQVHRAGESRVALSRSMWFIADLPGELSGSRPDACRLCFPMSSSPTWHTMHPGVCVNKSQGGFSIRKSPLIELKLALSNDDIG